MQTINELALTTLNSKESESLASKLSAALLLPQAVTAVIELLVNKALRLNNKQLNIHGLSQKVLTIKLTELSFPLSFTVNSTTTPAEVLVSTQKEQSDCVINTSITSLKKLKAQESLTQLIKQDKLDVIGDITIAQQFANIALSLEIDWQTEIAKHLGDIPTHHLLHLGNKMTRSFSTSCKKLQVDISEYLVHEKRLVITHHQIKAFNQEVTTLSKNMNELSIRINKLVAKTENTTVTN